MKKRPYGPTRDKTIALLRAGKTSGQIHKILGVHPAYARAVARRYGIIHTREINYPRTHAKRVMR